MRWISIKQTLRIQSGVRKNSDVLNRTFQNKFKDLIIGLQSYSPCKEIFQGLIVTTISPHPLSLQRSKAFYLVSLYPNIKLYKIRKMRNLCTVSQHWRLPKQSLSEKFVELPISVNSSKAFAALLSFHDEVGWIPSVFSSSSSFQWSRRI